MDTNVDDEINNHILLIPNKISNDKNNKLSEKEKRKNQKVI